MITLSRSKMLYALVVVVPAIVFFFIHTGTARRSNVSEFGKYHGYSKALYDGNKRISDYLTLSDGRRLAYDLFIPTKKRCSCGRAFTRSFQIHPLSAHLYRLR